MARVFLHEVTTPYHVKDYNLKDAMTAMNYIRNVFENRRSRRYDIFMFKSQPSFLQIFNEAPLITKRIKVNGNTVKKEFKLSQFGAFGESYPDHEPEVQMKDITTSLETANNFSHPYQERFAQHVEAAIRIATAPQATPDPSSKGLYYWRTGGSKPPSGFAEHFRDVLGLSFFTLNNEVPKPQYGAKD